MMSWPSLNNQLFSKNFNFVYQTHSNNEISHVPPHMRSPNAYLLGIHIQQIIGYKSYYCFMILTAAQLSAFQLWIEIYIIFFFQDFTYSYRLVLFVISRIRHVGNFGENL